MCITIYQKKEYTNGIMNGYDHYLKELPSGEIVILIEKSCYINVKELCHDIIEEQKNIIKIKMLMKSYLS